MFGNIIYPYLAIFRPWIQLLYPYIFSLWLTRSCYAPCMESLPQAHLPLSLTTPPFMWSPLTPLWLGDATPPRPILYLDLYIMFNVSTDSLGVSTANRNIDILTLVARILQGSSIFCFLNLSLFEDSLATLRFTYIFYWFLFTSLLIILEGGLGGFPPPNRNQWTVLYCTVLYCINFTFKWDRYLL